MNANRIVLVLCSIMLPGLLAGPVVAAAADPENPAVPAANRTFLISEYGNAVNRLIEFGPDGQQTWEHTPPSICVIFQPLADGHVLYAYGGKPTGVREVDRDGKLIWEYVSNCEQVLGCERLPNGNTLVGEQGPAQVVEVDPEGKIVSTIELTTTEEHFHRQVRAIHRLENGNTLVAHEGEGAVREYDKDGKIVWEYKGVSDVFEALRLENGNTLIAGGTQKRVIEVTPEGETAWELKAEDVPDLNLTWITSLQVLPNGNYLVGNFLRGQEGKGAHAFEVTRDKKVVWTFADHEAIRSLVMIRVLEAPEEQ